MRLAEPTKVCAGCKDRKPYSAFYAKTRWPDGSTRTVVDRCRPCHQERRNAQRRAARLANPAAARDRDLRTRRQVAADPERLATKRTYEREWYRRSRSVPASRFRAAHLPERYAECVD